MVCNSININRQFNLTLINLALRIRHPGDPRDSLLPLPSLFFCLQFVQISERNSLSLLPSYPWSFSGTPIAESPSLMLATESPTSPPPAVHSDVTLSSLKILSSHSLALSLSVFLFSKAQSWWSFSLHPHHRSWWCYHRWLPFFLSIVFSLIYIFLFLFLYAF